MKRLTLTIQVLVAGVWSAALHAGPTIHYVVDSVTTTDLGTLGGAQSSADDINDKGNIVGWAQTAGAIRHAFFYSAATGTFTDAGFWLGSATSEAEGINASDAVVGTWTSGGVRHAFRWTTAGALISLNDVAPTGVTLHSNAHAISDTGLIAGQRVWTDTLGHTKSYATVWSDDLTFYSIHSGTFSFYDDANDINASKAVVGEFDPTQPIPVQWNFNPAGSAVVHIPWMCPSLNDGAALGVNASGGVVGHAYCQTPGARHALYWDGFSPTSVDLGVLPSGHDSVATAIDDQIFIAGFADRTVIIGLQPPFTSDYAFIYHSDFGMRPLPKLPGGALSRDCHANDLNNLSVNSIVQVVGYCDTATGRRAVRWDVKIKKVILTTPP